jgi:hypothetical protein
MPSAYHASSHQLAQCLIDQEVDVLRESQLIYDHHIHHAYKGTAYREIGIEWLCGGYEPLNGIKAGR